jgi:hypothetical protein
MKPHAWPRRWLRVARWTGIAVCLALVAAWGLSLPLFLKWESGSSRFVWVGWGAVGVGYVDAPAFAVNNPTVHWSPLSRGFYFRPNQGTDAVWWLRFQTVGTPVFNRMVTVPLWMPLLLAGAPTALLWRPHLRIRRRMRLGHCPGCGYDRRGLAAEIKCPECAMLPTK